MIEDKANFWEKQFWIGAAAANKWKYNTQGSRSKGTFEQRCAVRKGISYVLISVGQCMVDEFEEQLEKALCLEIDKYMYQVDRLI